MLVPKPKLWNVWISQFPSFQGRTNIRTTMAWFDAFYHFAAFRYKSLFSGLLMVPVLGMEGRKSRGSWKRCVKGWWRRRRRVGLASPLHNWKNLGTQFPPFFNKTRKNTQNLEREKIRGSNLCGVFFQMLSIFMILQPNWSEDLFLGFYKDVS